MRLLALGVIAAIAFATTEARAEAMRVPLTVREWSGIARAHEPVTAGVPFAPGALRDVSALAALNEKGERIPAQFTVTAKWPDGSVRWLLCDFQASVGANGAAEYALTEGPTDRSLRSERRLRPVAEAVSREPAPLAGETPLRLEEDEGKYTVTTGPLRFTVLKQGFDLLHEVWVDRDGDGTFSDDELMASSGPDLGLALLGPGGEGRYTSGHGEVTETTVEYRGPVRIGLRVRGTLKDARGSGELRYTARIEAFAGQSYVRTTVTLENPNAGGRLSNMDSNYWGLGGTGNVLFREFALVQKLHLDSYPYVEFGEGGEVKLERLPLLESARAYQDSSGGEHWYHRNHVNRDLRIPLKFRGYEVVHDGTQVVRGDRFEGWLDLADVRWGCAVGIRDLWQNFPSALEAKSDGTLSAALWPRFSAADHELIAGEQKTHEVVWYFRAHRPYPRRVMQVAADPLTAWAPAEVYLASGEFGRHVPYNEKSFPEFERFCASAVLNPKKNFTTDRETIDEYGWRSFGDVWAANERDQTGGPRQGELMVSHFNLEYDEGWGIILHAARTAEVKPELSRDWWRFGREAALHEADIDIHHSTLEAGENGAWAGGKQTHTEHGVEAERSAHTGRVAPHVFGTLKWPWGPGGGPESGHWNSRGMMFAYYLTGNRRFLDAAMDITRATAWKIENDTHAQIDVPDRTAGHNIQILTDAYLLTWDPRYRALLDKAVDAAHADKVLGGKEPEEFSYWQLGIYLRALGRYVDTAALVDGKAPARAADSLVKYARAMAEMREKEGGGPWKSPTTWASDAFMMAARYVGLEADRARFVKLAGEAFDCGWRQYMEGMEGYLYLNAKTTTMTFTGGGEWMWHRSQRH